MARRSPGWAALAVSAVIGTAAEAQCRQALALGLDVSGSVDAEEYRSQVDGLAEALGSDEVRAALLSLPSQPVRIAVFEWSGPRSQVLILPWTEIDGPARIGEVIARLHGTERRAGELSTAIGAAMAAGFGLLADQPGCARRTLDLSGDGASNTGLRPEVIRAQQRPEGVTINALVIGDGPGPDGTGSRTLDRLAAYYRANVIAGDGAFVEMALGFESYGEAMERKLLRELAAIAIGLGPDPAEGPATPPG